MREKLIKIFKQTNSILILLWLLFAFAQAQTKTDITGTINPDPNCGGGDLCVEWKQDNKARSEYRSEFFYVVVLKSTKKCQASEKERAEFQKIFTKNKVFLEQAACEDGAEKRFSYADIGNHLHSFIAVYAGKTKVEAERFLRIVKVKGKFLGANIRKTQVILGGT